VLANDIEGDVLMLQAPAASIFGKAEGENMPLQAYARFLAAQGVSPETVITRMKFDTKAEAPKLFFKPMRWLTEEEYAIAVEKGQSPEAKQAITMTVAQMDKVPAPAPMELPGKPPQRAAAPAPAPVPAPAPAPAAEDDDEAPPPAPRRGRPPKAVVEARKAAEPAAEEPPEPVVQRAPAPPAAAPKTPLAKLAADWDDE